MSSTNRGPSTTMHWGRTMVFLLAGIVLAVSMVMISMHGSLRVRLDATKTRAYSLSPRTTTLLESLEGEWRIAVVMVESERDEAVARQIDEVLERYGLTLEEFASWQRAVDRSGMQGLRVTRIQHYRDLYERQLKY